MSHVPSPFLEICDTAYRRLVARADALERRGHDEQALTWASLAAGVAWGAHPGRFVDGRLEAVGMKIGRRLGRPSRDVGERHGPPRRAGTTRRVLHVASTVSGVGGHTRLIENWIKRDRSALHRLLLLDQRRVPIPERLARALEGAGGDVIRLPPELSLLERASRLRAAAGPDTTCIILHHHPNDVVPLVALAVEGGPPVAVMNHADDLFWLGASVADVVCDFRDFGARLSVQRRFAPRSMRLPLPLDPVPRLVDRREARKRLGVPDDEVVLLSIGTPYKYTPTPKYHFFRTLDAILTRNPSATLYMVGVRARDLAYFGASRHERVRLVGPVDDPFEYQHAADLYLEGFPYGSDTALLETAALGVCPVLMYAPNPQADSSSYDAFRGLIAGAPDEPRYIEHVSSLIAEPARRQSIGRAVAEQVDRAHRNEHWEERLRAIYEYLEATQHRPRPIPETECAATEDDLNLAAFHHARIKTAVLQQIKDNVIERLTLGDVWRLFGISVLIGDTRFTPAQVRLWLRLLGAKTFSSSGAAVGDGRA